MSKKILMILGIIVLAVGVVGISNSFAVGTTYDTTITNSAYVAGGNFENKTNSITTNVLRIAGGNWIGEDDITSGISAGNLVTNTTYLTNLGNDAFTFTFSVINNADDGVAANHHPWAWRIYQDGAAVGGWNYGNASPGNLTAVNSGASTKINFVVQVSNNAAGGWEHYEFQVVDSGTHQNTTNYPGDNGTQYGGPTSTGWGAIVANALICNATNDADGGGDGSQYWRIQVSGPTISIIKRITSILVVDTAGPDNVAVPGATVTYTIVVTNSGSGAANGPLVIKDTVPTTYVDYVGGSMSQPHDDAGGTWVTNVALPTISWSNNAGSLASGGWVSLQFTATIK